MTVNYLAAAACEYRDLEPELLNRRGHAIDHSVILARVTSVRDEFVDRPKLDVLGHRLREHASPPKVILGILPEGALGAGLSNRSDYDCTPEPLVRKSFFARDV